MIRSRPGPPTIPPMATRRSSSSRQSTRRSQAVGVAGRQASPVSSGETDTLRRKRLLAAAVFLAATLGLLCSLGLRQRQPRHPHRGRQPLFAPGGAHRAALPARGGRRRSAGERGVAHAQAAPRGRVRAVPGPDAVVGGLPVLRRPRPDAPRPRVCADRSWPSSRTA